VHGDGAFKVTQCFHYRRRLKGKSRIFQAYPPTSVKSLVCAFMSATMSKGARLFSQTSKHCKCLFVCVCVCVQAYYVSLTIFYGTFHLSFFASFDESIYVRGKQHLEPNEKQCFRRRNGLLKAFFRV
jgi:hypothetical protein